MTKKNALTIALNALNLVNTDEATEARVTVQAMLDQLNKSHPVSEETRAAINEKRKAATAAARAEMVAAVSPAILRVMSSIPMTAKEIFAAAKDNLPEDYTAAKVQNVLLRELRNTVTITETKGKANTYSL